VTLAVSLAGLALAAEQLLASLGGLRKRGPCDIEIQDGGHQGAFQSWVLIEK